MRRVRVRSAAATHCTENLVRTWCGPETRAKNPSAASAEWSACLRAVHALWCPPFPSQNPYRSFRTQEKRNSPPLLTSTPSESDFGLCLTCWLLPFPSDTPSGKLHPTGDSRGHFRLPCLLSGHIVSQLANRGHASAVGDSSASIL